jgi:sec-independent protein translocase protein TatC
VSTKDQIEDGEIENGENGEGGDMSFLDHLEELRWHLIRAFLAILIFAIGAFLAKDFVWNKLILGPSRVDFPTFQLLCKAGEALNSEALCITELPFIIQSRKMTGQFSMHITSSIVLGLIFSFPYVFWELWRFISPGMYRKERRYARGAVFWVSLLFSMGVLFGYYIISPLSINFLSHYQVDPTVQNEFDITSYVSTMTMLILACAFVFQLPVVVFFLSKVGFVTPSLMRRFRKHSIVVILILAAMLTPPDPISQILIALPLFALYQISIYISAVVLRRERRALGYEGEELNEE